MTDPVLTWDERVEMEMERLRNGGVTHGGALEQEARRRLDKESAEAEESSPNDT